MQVKDLNKLKKQLAKLTKHYSAGEEKLLFLYLDMAYLIGNGVGYEKACKMFEKCYE